MTAILSLLLVVTLSILVTRIAAVALRHTGLARQTARFQARSAFSGAGFTTSELVLGILTAAGEWLGTPAGDSRPEGGDTLVAYGRTSAMQTLTRRRAGDEQGHWAAVADQTASPRGSAAAPAAATPDARLRIGPALLMENRARCDRRVRTAAPPAAAAGAYQPAGGAYHRPPSRAVPDLGHSRARLGRCCRRGAGWPGDCIRLR